MRILLIAADPMEFPGILRHTTEVKPAGLPVDWSRSARLGTHELVLVANGAGAHRAAAAVDAALERFPADAIVSTGFCGALAAELATADVVVASAVSAGGRTFAALSPASHGVHRMGVVYSIDHVAQTAEEKRRLRAAGGSAVEMEAGGVAERAVALGVPFYCVKVVTDLAGEDMANDFNRALRPDGHFATMSILLGALRHPQVCLPELIRLRNRCIRGARVLGDFIADCRF
jgi:adenosylhomocysteine nucleosidase